MFVPHEPSQNKLLAARDPFGLPAGSPQKQSELLAEFSIPAVSEQATVAAERDTDRH